MRELGLVYNYIYIYIYIGVFFSNFRITELGPGQVLGRIF